MYDVWEVVVDIESAVGEVFPDFLRERITTRHSLVRAMSAVRTVKHGGDMYFTLTKEDVERMGCNLKTVMHTLSKYELLRWTGNKPSHIRGEAKRYVATPGYVKVMKIIDRQEARLKVYYKEVGERGKLVDMEDAPDREVQSQHTTLARVDVEGVCSYNKTLCDEDVHSKVTSSRLTAIIKGSDGMLTQDYYRKVNGRLHSGGSDCFQNAPKELRKSAFRGQWEVDFVNCHVKLASAYTDNKALDEYANSPGVIRYVVSKELGIPESVVKEGILMLMYGCGMSLRKGSALVESMGKTVSTDFLDNTRIKLIIDGLEELKKDLFRGGCLVPLDNGKRTVEQMVAMFLQRKEGEVLDVCLREYEASLLLFDGFISESRVDTNFLENKIREELGVEIRLTQKLIGEYDE